MAPSPCLFSVYCPCLGFPGEGPAIFSTLNCTSLPKRFQSILHFLDSDTNSLAMSLQETRIPPKKVSALQRQAVQSGWTLHVGSQPGLRKVSGPKACFRQPTGGLAFLVKKHIPSTQIELPNEWRHLSDVCMPVWLAIEKGRTGVVVLNCYLPSGVQAKEERESLLSDVFSYASTLDSTPVILSGDFQMDPKDSQAMSLALLSGLWSDYYSDYRSAQSLPIEATFCAQGWTNGFVGRGKTRIDHMFLNTLALVAAKEASIFRGPLAPGHAVVSVRLEFDLFSSFCWTQPKVPQWNLPPKPTTDVLWDERNALCLPIFQTSLPQLLAFAETLQAEEFWQDLCNMLHLMLNKISQQSISSTRGSIPTFSKTCVVPPPTRATLFQKRVSKIRRLLHELTMKINHWKSSHPVWLTQTKQTAGHVFHDMRALGCSVSLPDDSPECFSKFVDQCSVALIELESKMQQQNSVQKIKQWKERLRLSNAKDRKQVHQWLKGQLPQHAKILKRPDGSLTGDPNEILSLLSSHVQNIYTTHKDIDEDQLFRNFCSNYRDSINALKTPASVPELTALELWKAFQNKPDFKASGVDQWQVKELKSLPICAWEAIALFYKLVEATGVWPASFKIISITAIPKGENDWTPDSTRAIAISSIFYSHWASTRFRHLSSWVSHIAPASLLGGLPKRSAVESEIGLSSELFESELFEGEARMVIFIDRFKCFDLLMPRFCLALSQELGLPLQIAKAVNGFYHGQIKCFKLGQAFGDKVLHCNGVLQGCSFSVLFANLIFSVFAKHVDSISGVSFASFIDDTKIWAKLGDLPALIQATQDLSSFDASIGQVQNDKKSCVLTRKQKDAQRFLVQVGRQFEIKKTTKSLGFHHKVSRRGGAKALEKQINKATAVVSRISHLPLPPAQKALFIKSNADSKWVYGSEIQAPSKSAIKKLRTAVVNAVFPRKNHMRCPYLCMVSFNDLWVDPWARWVLHVLSTYRKLARTNPSLASKVFAQAKKFKGAENDTLNGAPAALSRILKELHWQWTDDQFVFTRDGDVMFSLVAGSQTFFLQELDRSVRRSLFMCSPERHDNLGECRGRHVDVTLTRFLLDNDFTNRDVFESVGHLVKALLTTIEHAQRILQYILTGSVYDHVRKFKASLVETESCPHCGDRNTFLHMSKVCSHLSRPSFAISIPETTWATGIFFESDSFAEFRASQHDVTISDLPDPTFLEGNDVFIDGSCFHSVSKRVAQAASAVYVPGISQFSCKLPGLDHSSQRSEIFSLILAFRLFQGHMRVFSDCENVVKGFAVLQQCRFDATSICTWDNFDLWQEVCSLALLHEGEVSVVKVAAHGRDRSQLPSLTRGNQMADALAKAAAKMAFAQYANLLLPEIETAVQLHSHLVQLFFSNFSSYDQTQGDKNQPSKLERPRACGLKPRCTCAPSSRFNKKGPLICKGTCPSAFSFPSNVEQCFLSLVEKGDLVPERVWSILKARYPSFALWIDWKTHPYPAQPVSDVVPDRKRKLSS